MKRFGQCAGTKWWSLSVAALLLALAVAPTAQATNHLNACYVFSDDPVGPAPSGYDVCEDANLNKPWQLVIGLVVRTADAACNGFNEVVGLTPFGEMLQCKIQRTFA